MFFWSKIIPLIIILQSNIHVSLLRRAEVTAQGYQATAWAPPFKIHVHSQEYHLLGYDAA
jgi:hypothetical protein